MLWKSACLCAPHLINGAQLANDLGEPDTDDALEETVICRGGGVLLEHHSDW